MKNVVRKWVHLSYSRDLQEIGYKVFQSNKRPFDAFLLTEDEWKSFREMYPEDPPTLYDNIPER